MKDFQKIYEEHHIAMVRVASKMVNDTDVVSDIVQEVFIYLHEKLSEDVKILHLRSWLYRITFNKCVDHLRKQRKFVDLSQAEDVKMEEQATSDPDKKAAISRAILRLSEKEKVLVVAYSEGLSYKEMADLTEIRFASIGKTLARSLKKMEYELKKEQHGMFR